MDGMVMGQGPPGHIFSEPGIVVGPVPVFLGFGGLFDRTARFGFGLNRLQPHGAATADRVVNAVIPKAVIPAGITTGIPGAEPPEAGAMIPAAATTEPGKGDGKADRAAERELPFRPAVAGDVAEGVVFQKFQRSSVNCRQQTHRTDLVAPYT